ncbi:hypothetical protein [Ideonella sp.]|uniref:hypothetical protein n=1 Tax=Ideonella sp. TaxID=1929293 RepID=UPI0035B44964
MELPAPIRIDADGAVHVGTVAIDGRTLLHTGRQALGERVAAQRQGGTGYLWLSLAHVTFGGRPAGAGLCFRQDGLVMVTLGLSLPDDELSDSWPTEASSLRQMAFMSRELERQLNVTLTDGSASFPWGTVWSRFDPKGFMATAGVSYRR